MINFIKNLFIEYYPLSNEDKRDYYRTVLMMYQSAVKNGYYTPLCYIVANRMYFPALLLKDFKDRLIKDGLVNNENFTYKTVWEITDSESRIKYLQNILSEI